MASKIIDEYFNPDEIEESIQTSLIQPMNPLNLVFTISAWELLVPGKKDCYNTEFIYNWFKDRDFWIWSMDRYSNVGGTLPDFSTNAEHSKFLIELFDLAMKDIREKGFAPMIRTVSAAIGGVLYDSPGDRWGGTCQSDFVVINPDGRLNNCPDKDSFEERSRTLICYTINTTCIPCNWTT